MTTAGKTSWKETDSRGLVTKAHDNGGDIIYTYYPDGKPKTITAPGGIITSMEYDIAGNQTLLVDPSAGTLQYVYDSFGRLKTQKNGRNQETEYTYYDDGRIKTKTTPEGTTTYTYNSNKQLTGISSTNGVSRSYGYDILGRVDLISESISNSVFSTTFTFDNIGRLKTRTYPSGIVETINYNSYGYVSSVSAGGTTSWSITAMNARQQIVSGKYGNSLFASFGYDNYGYPVSAAVNNMSAGHNIQDYRYSFNTTTGNTASRQNYLKNLSESFTYDNLDRLTGVAGPQNLSMQYYDNGNIKARSDISTADFSYKSDRPYALGTLKNSYGVIPEVPQSAAYTSFEQISTLSEGDYQATFLYNSDDQRCRMTVKKSNSTILTRWYVGSRYIKETAGSITKEYTWIGGDAYTAPVMAVKENGNISYYYLLRDYLGTITHVVDASNNFVVAEYSYDAWGRRRDKDTWKYSLDNEPGLFAGRGFTGHEYLSWFRLYNMNGRLYDPLVGRFLSPDNFIQVPDFTRNFNRYSYCLNNPLVYTDPDGEFIFTALTLIAAPFTGGASLALLPYAIAADIGGNINTVSNWKNIDNFVEGLAAYGLGAGTGALTAVNPALGATVGGALTSAGNDIIG